MCLQRWCNSPERPRLVRGCSRQPASCGCVVPLLTGTAVAAARRQDYSWFRGVCTVTAALNCSGVARHVPVAARGCRAAFGAACLCSERVLLSECQNELLKWLGCWREIFKAAVPVCSGGAIACWRLITFPVASQGNGRSEVADLLINSGITLSLG